MPSTGENIRNLPNPSLTRHLIHAGQDSNSLAMQQIRGLVEPNIEEVVRADSRVLFFWMLGEKFRWVDPDRVVSEMQKRGLTKIDFDLGIRRGFSKFSPQDLGISWDDGQLTTRPETGHAVFYADKAPENPYGPTIRQLGSPAFCDAIESRNSRAILGKALLERNLHSAVQIMPILTRSFLPADHGKKVTGMRVVITVSYKPIAPRVLRRADANETPEALRANTASIISINRVLKRSPEARRATRLRRTVPGILHRAMT